MAPELVRYLAAGQRPAPEELDRRIDIFGLGVTLFELAYGRYPFGTLPANKSRAQAAEQHWAAQRAGPTLPPDARTRVDRRIEEMLVRCLEFEPAKRPQSMAELSQFFRGQLQPSRRVGRWLRVHRRLMSSAATVACGGALVVGGWLTARDPYPVREWHQGQGCYQDGANAAAVEHLTAALQNDSHLVDARLLRACASCRQKDYAAAYADFELLSRELPAGWPLAGLAQVASAWQADYRRAGLLYGMAVERGCDSPLLLNNLGYCLIKSGQFLKAKEFLRQALAGNPQLSAAHHNLARAELMLAILENRTPGTGEITQALQFCPETAELDLDASRTYAIRAHLAVVDESGGRDLDKMFEFLERAADRGATFERLTSVLPPGLPPDSALKRDERWALLEAHAPIGTDFTRAELLLDLLDELRSWQTDAVSDIASR
jgi:tetratricopeptide (TPR) repeat protein